MVKYIVSILIILLFSMPILSQVIQETSEVNFYEESLFLHVISDDLTQDNTLQKEQSTDQYMNIAAKLERYPYQKNLDLNQIVASRDKNAILELSLLYIKEKDFSSAQKLIANLKSSDFGKNKKETFQFLRGYLNFVNKDFNQAQKVFDTPEIQKGKYKFESLYYSAFCDMFNGEYEASFLKFSRLQNQQQYQTDLPYYRALMKYQQEDYKSAILILKPELPHTQSIYLEEMNELLSRAYYKENKWEQLSDILLSDKNCCKSPEEHYFVGLSLYKRGMKEKAIPHLMEASKTKNKDGQNALLALGDIHKNLNPNQSLIYFKQASVLSFDQNLKDQALLNMSKTYIKKGQNILALSTLGRVSSSSIHYEQSLSERLKIHYDLNDFDNALSTVNLMRDQAPNIYQDLLVRAGLKHLQNKNFKTAINFLNEASLLDNNEELSLKASYALVKIYSDLGKGENLKEAVNRYENISEKTSITHHQEDAEVYYWLGHSFLKQKKYTHSNVAFQKAGKAILMAFQSDPQGYHEEMYEDILLRQADVHFRLGDKSKAIKYYVEAEDQHKKHGDYALYQKGKIEDLMNEPYLQMSTFDQLEKKHPNSPYLVDAWLQKAKSLSKLDKHTEAFDQYSNVYSSNKSTDLQKYTALSQLGIITYNKGDLETALSFYKRIFEIEKISPEHKNASLLALEEIYLNDLQNAEGYYAFLDKIDSPTTSYLNKDSIDYNLALLALRNDKIQGINKLNTYLKTHKNGVSRVDALKEIIKTYESTQEYDQAIAAYKALMSESTSSKELALIGIINILALDESKVDQYISYNLFLLEENYSQKINDLAYTNIAKASTNIDNISDYDKHILLAIKGGMLNVDEEEIIRLSLVKAYVSQKKYDASKTHLEVLARSKNPKIAAQSILIIAERLDELGKYKEALSATEKALDKYKEEKHFVSKVIWTQAKIYYNLDELDSSQIALETLLQTENLDSALISKCDSLLGKIKIKRIAEREKNNPTINLQYGTHE